MMPAPEVTERNKETAQRIIEEILNRGNFDFADESMTDDLVFYFHRTEPHRGPQAVKDAIANLRNGFPDIHFEIQHVFGEGDTVITQEHMTATHTGRFEGIPPTYRETTMVVVHLFDFAEDGRAKQIRVVWDSIKMPQQLGVAPSGDAIPKPVIWFVTAKHYFARLRGRNPPRI